MTQPLSEIQLLDPEVKRLFLDALRSGKYPQGRTRLRNHEDCYCCLGVLTDLAVKAGIVKWAQSDYGWGVDVTLPNGTSFINTSDLHDKVIQWAGLQYETGVGGNIVFGASKEDNLMHCNDELLLTFEQIADIVEEQL